MKSFKVLSIMLIPMALQACAHESASVVNAGSSHAVVEENYDKFEGFNRFSFEVNNQLDNYVLRPLAKGYRAVTTQYIRDRVNLALANLKEPMSSVNNILQGEFASGLKNIGRFAINSTLGLAGMYDVAGGGFGLEPHPSNFDMTLANWCVKDGPFIVLPIIGPTTPRAILGDAFDGLGNPVVVATYNDANTRDKILYPYFALSAVAARETNMEMLDDVKKSSVDFYATVRSAFLQNRKQINKCGVNTETESQTLDYDFDFDMDEED
ncbi:MAG: VacJ family lipoprotein [Lactobacillaceae bacterium]|jgi:phospholipid-binding lipoprotein MlaA|nr:VacJ family lipoprotein [Lactobacillaceae bacterium]